MVVIVVMVQNNTYDIVQSLFYSHACARGMCSAQLQF